MAEIRLANCFSDIQMTGNLIKNTFGGVVWESGYLHYAKLHPTDYMKIIESKVQTATERTDLTTQTHRNLDITKSGANR